MTPNKMFMAMVVNIMILLFIFVPESDAFVRHLCPGEVGVGRIDPIISPGQPSAHCHGIHGASNMGFTTDYETLIASNCTSCSARQDKSAYWSPYLYFHHANGTYELVPKNGGLTVYYFTEAPYDVPGSKIVAFPPGFRMVAGSNFKRAFYNTTEKQQQPPNAREWTQHAKEQAARAERVIGFNCLHYYRGHNEDAYARHEIPQKDFIDKECDQGVRAEILFPSCWNGQPDSPNHADHVAYPVMPRNGACPEGYDQRLPALLYETIYLTPLFRGLEGEYVLANGDPTGYGYHGDFVNGWEEGVLQQVIDSVECTHGGVDGRQEDCPILDLQSEGDSRTCGMKIPEVIQSEQLSLIESLPGNVKIERGPGFAQMPSHNDDQGPPTSAETESPSSVSHESATSTVSTLSSSSASSVTPTSTQAATSSNEVTSPVSSGFNASTQTLTYTSYLIDDAMTVEVVVLQEIVYETVHVLAVTAVTTVVLPTPLAPVKKRHLHSHGRVHV